MRFGIRDVASRFGVSEKDVLRWVEEMGLPVSKVDGGHRFSPDALFEWATARGMKIPATLFQDPESDERELLPNLVDALRAGGVVSPVRGADKRSVLAELVAHLKLPKGVDREGLLQILLAREQLGSTGIGEGIAIPHVRNPIVMRVPKPMLVLGLLERPIDYGAVDRRPVHALFLVVAPTTRAHLHILSRLGYVLRDGRLRELLEARASVERILEAMREAESRIPGAAIHAGKGADTNAGPDH
jgi:PTS system nitrogen regulatory IIA component